jgi:lipopolysaccharide export LptBFGC system permease protein LptF
MVLRIFDRYLGRQVLSATLMGVLLLSGVMVLGNVYKKLDELLGGTQLPFGFILEFIGLIIPFSLIFTIPWAFLTAILLVFGRLSADNELVSLRMTGWSMPRICLPVFLLAVALSGVCYWVNLSLAPMAKDRIKRMFYEVALENPSALFQPGQVLDKVPGFSIHTGGRDGDRLLDLHIIELDRRQPRRVIRARSAVLESQPGEIDVVMVLEDAEIEEIRYGEEQRMEKADFLRAGRTALLFPLSRLKNSSVRVNASMKSTEALWSEVRQHRDSVDGAPMEPKERARSLTELSKRYSFPLACCTFALVGIPLGVTAQRRETSTGFALSLITATVYLVFIILADTLSDKPHLYPHLIMWAPNVIFLATGGWLFQRLNQR